MYRCLLFREGIELIRGLCPRINENLKLKCEHDKRKLRCFMCNPKLRCKHDIHKLKCIICNHKKWDIPQDYE